MNNTIKVVEHEDFPEEPAVDIVKFALPGYKEDRRNLFTQYHKACRFFALACAIETGEDYD
jgi:c-di-GMP-related signal transduction protein